MSTAVEERSDTRGLNVFQYFTSHQQSGGLMTSQKIDEAKGRVKEAAGALAGDEPLKHEGRIDQAKAAAKNAIDKAADALNGRKHDKQD
jgi:uncharacterized protein YjbJ (UPF0337 family)